MECFILWCDARSVINIFDLQQSIYISHGDDGVYTVDVYKPKQDIKVQIDDRSNHPIVNFLNLTYTKPKKNMSWGDCCDSD